ncbi:MAG: hypothetical protein PHT77_11885 [Bacteroidales bacterium]|nr:hypothetical protein [Bacteroidales bacterium]
MGLSDLVFGAFNVSKGLDVNKPANPNPGDQYIATDTKKIYVCYEKVGFDISTAVFSQSISTQDASPSGITFNSDGSKMYEVGYGLDKIYEYVLVTPFDISTAVFSQSIDTQDANPRGLTFNSDGSKMYEIGSNSDKIYEYVLVTPFDISTAVFSQSIDTQDTAPTGVTFNSDGSKMYEVGCGLDKIYEYVLVTPFDISTAVFSQSIDTQDGNSRGLTFNSDGSKMYEIGSDSDKIYEYVLVTPFDISTAVFSQSIDTQDGGPSGITFNSDGSKMYEVGYGLAKIYEYDLQKVGQWEEYKTTLLNEIKMFAGLEADIPVGWQLCDGSNGTPDLRNRFIVGVGDSYTFGDIGGENSHILTVDELAPHTHTFPRYSGYKNEQPAVETMYSSSVGVSSSTGGGEAHENRPPYFALCFIMAVGSGGLSVEAAIVQDSKNYNFAVPFAETTRSCLIISDSFTEFYPYTIPSIKTQKMLATYAVEIPNPSGCETYLSLNGVQVSPLRRQWNEGTPFLHTFDFEVIVKTGDVIAVQARNVPMSKVYLRGAALYQKL